jgi:hypothetical protein
MRVADWFETFCSNIQVKNGASISTRYKTIAQRLNTDFWSTTSDTAHSLYVGFYDRNTAIQGFSDPDMLMELPSSVYCKYDAYTANGRSALLQAVRNSLAKTHPSTSIGGDGQVIAISFTDGITSEIVPVFTNSSGSYTNPDSNRGGSRKPQTQDRKSTPSASATLPATETLFPFAG